MDSYISMNIDNMTTLTEEAFESYKIAKDNLVAHNILVEESAGMNTDAVNAINNADNTYNNILSQMLPLDQENVAEQNHRDAVIVWNNHQANTQLNQLLDEKLILAHIKITKGHEFNNSSYKNIDVIVSMLREKNDWSKIIPRTIEMSEILLPILKEKSIVSEILTMKQDMETAALRIEMKYLEEKFDVYSTQMSETH